MAKTLNLLIGGRRKKGGAGAAQWGAPLNRFLSGYSGTLWTLNQREREEHERAAADSGPRKRDKGLARHPLRSHQPRDETLGLAALHQPPRPLQHRQLHHRMGADDRWGRVRKPAHRGGERTASAAENQRHHPQDLLPLPQGPRLADERIRVGKDLPQVRRHQHLPVLLPGRRRQPLHHLQAQDETFRPSPLQGDAGSHPQEIPGSRGAQHGTRGSHGL